MQARYEEGGRALGGGHTDATTEIKKNLLPQDEQTDQTELRRPKENRYERTEVRDECVVKKNRLRNEALFTI